MSRLHRSRPAGILAVFLAAAMPGPAAAAVTTNNYSSSSVSENIAASCKDLEVSTAGILSGSCNKAGGSKSGNVTANAATLDMKDVLDCVGSASGGYSMAWSSSPAFDGIVEDPAVSTGSTGQGYVLSGKCKPTGGTASPASMIDLSDTVNGLKNDNGAFAKR